MSDLETKLREAIYKAGRGAIENSTDPGKRQIVKHLGEKGLHAAGNAYADLILPVILPIIESELP